MATKKKIAKASPTSADPYVGLLLEKISDGKRVLMGLIDYASTGFTVKTELLTDVVLHD